MRFKPRPAAVRFRVLAAATAADRERNWRLFMESYPGLSMVGGTMKVV